MNWHLYSSIPFSTWCLVSHACHQNISTAFFGFSTEQEANQSKANKTGTFRICCVHDYNLLVQYLKVSWALVRNATAYLKSSYASLRGQKFRLKNYVLPVLLDERGPNLFSQQSHGINAPLLENANKKPIQYLGASAFLQDKIVIMTVLVSLFMHTPILSATTKNNSGKNRCTNSLPSCIKS